MSVEERPVRRSIEVLTEWMRENRSALDKRLDAQDERLLEILSEARRTNGRVTALERRADLADALSEGKDSWLSALHSEQSQRTARRDGWLQASLSFIGGGVVVALGHVLGWW